VAVGARATLRTIRGELSMKKYRIVKNGEMFHIERKTLWFWRPLGYYADGDAYMDGCFTTKTFPSVILAELHLSKLNAKSQVVKEWREI